MPKVSVIIPCFNQGDFIQQAIDSVLAQIFKDLEIIIVDDGSTEDDTKRVLNKLKTEKFNVVGIENKGVSFARNYGIMKSMGEYILPLDADDWIEPNFLSLAVPALDENKRLELIGTGVEYFGEINKKEFLPEYDPKDHLVSNLFFNTSLFRRKTFDANNGYDENLKLGWEDWDLFLRMVTSKSQVLNIREYLLHYRIKASSRNANLTNEKKQSVEQQFFQKHIKRYLYFFPEPIQMLRDKIYLENQVAKFEIYKSSINNSYSYRLGTFILSPIKWLRKF